MTLAEWVEFNGREFNERSWVELVVENHREIKAS